MSDQDVVILCPGQGAQHTGMGKAWFAASGAAAEVFEQADAELGIDLSRTCFEGPDEQVNRTDVAQAAIYTTSIACWRALQQNGAVAHPVAAAGLSLGEYTALHLAGVFSFLDGLRLVAQRGRFMQEAAEAEASGMVAIIGAEEAQVNELCNRAAAGQELVPANFNCPGQIVISGHIEACDRALTIADEMGLRATKLAVAGAFHSPLMQRAADRMARALDEVNFHAPDIPVMSNVTGEVHGRDVDDIKALLVQQITGAVRWESNCRHLIQNNPGRFIELAPGKTLKGLMRRIDRNIDVENYAEPQT